MKTKKADEELKKEIDEILWFFYCDIITKGKTKKKIKDSDWNRALNYLVRIFQKYTKEREERLIKRLFPEKMTEKDWKKNCRLKSNEPISNPL